MSTSPHQYLLEIGTEELPAGFLESAPAELTDAVRQCLDEQGLTCQDVSVLATPRRLALRVMGLPARQADREVVLKGPPARIGLDAEGKPTQAALGFAKKSGIDASALKPETLDESGETYLVARQTVAGKDTRAVLAEQLPALVLGLSGSHFMRWANHEIRFSRPIRWLLSLWDDTHLPLQIGPVSSGTVTYGHRVLSAGEIPVASVDAYERTLETQGKVLVDQCRRRERIWTQLQEAARAVGGEAPANEALLDTVNMLVEAPSVVTGRFKEAYLSVPSEVITTVMAVHQKYFPVTDASGRLLPCFLAVSNARPEAADTVVRGNEKVITARLEDARFFFEDDQKTPLGERLDALAGVTFQKGLGTMRDKTRRLVALSGVVADALGYPAGERSAVLRAAELCKADLVTGMVFEFTELQGVMGQKYAALQGEPQAVADAIFEHYLPRFNGDQVARSRAGVAVSLADKLDTMVCVFAQENAKLPTGSKDPMGLRRMALGVIQTVLQNGLRIDLTALLRSAYQALGALATADEAAAMGRLGEFMRQRLKVSLLEDNLRHDVIDAVLDADEPFADLARTMTRLAVMKQLVQDETRLKAIYEPANRISRILGEHFNPAVSADAIDRGSFRHESEGALLEAARPLAACLDDEALTVALAALAQPVEAFFEAVLINDPDEAVRKNRYNLLSLLNAQYLRLGLFSRLVVS